MEKGQERWRFRTEVRALTQHREDRRDERIHVDERASVRPGPTTDPPRDGARACSHPCREDRTTARGQGDQAEAGAVMSVEYDWKHPATITALSADWIMLRNLMAKFLNTPHTPI